MRPALLLTVLVLLGAAAPASGATFALRIDEECDRGGCYPVSSPQFLAAPGEANRVSLALAGDGVLLVEEGASVAAGDGCRALDSHSVTCPLGPQVLVLVDTADGNDSVVSDVEYAALQLGAGDDTFSGQGRVLGQEGADTLTGGATRAILNGGPGADVITGGPSSDLLFGGADADDVRGEAGDDELTGDADGTPADDRLDGGPGRDQVSFSERSVPVTVGLSDGLPDGSAGERDQLIDVEGVEGGTASDTLTGDAGPNTLRASAPQPGAPSRFAAALVRTPSKARSSTTAARSCPTAASASQSTDLSSFCCPSGRAAAPTRSCSPDPRSAAPRHAGRH